MNVSLSTAVAFGALLVLTLPGVAQRGETDVDRDVRTFYESAGSRPVWIDARGQPSLDARSALARLREVAEDGLEPGDYQADELAAQALALEGAGATATIAAAEFDAVLTASVLRYLRHLHLGRVNPRALGFDLDHAAEPHDFPVRLRAALADHGFDRVVEELRPAFAQYRWLRNALAAHRGREAARERQIELALERMRWLPDLAGERLLIVNIPMFYLWGWEVARGDGVPSIAMAAITGKASTTETPVFASTITSIVVNPDWIVPESIIENEILPAIAGNRDYLVQHQMEMTRIGGTTRVRQRPGPWNALGPIKFVLPNVYGVYLHGTPAPSLFGAERRDFSHGCVRVADPFALAQWVLRDEPGWPGARIREAVADGATRVIKVGRPPRVVLFYMTAAFVPGDGIVRFADDVYGHDARLDALLGAPADRSQR